MQKFLALYMAPREMMDQWRQMSEEDQKKGMDQWVAWGEKHKPDLVDFGNPVGANTRITKDGANETPNDVGGWSIVQASSKEDAIKIFEDSPHFSGGDGSYIELMPIVDMG